MVAFFSPHEHFLLCCWVPFTNLVLFTWSPENGFQVVAFLGSGIKRSQTYAVFDPHIQINHYIMENFVKHLRIVSPEFQPFLMEQAL